MPAAPAHGRCAILPVGRSLLEISPRSLKTTDPVACRDRFTHMLPMTLSLGIKMLEQTAGRRTDNQAVDAPFPRCRVSLESDRSDVPACSRFSRPLTGPFSSSYRPLS